MTSIFDSQGDERLDLQTRERAFSWLLDRHPEAPVGAFEAKGLFVEMPDTVALRENQVMTGRSGLDSVSDNEQAFVAMALAWERMLATGAGHCAVPRTGLSEVTVYWVDMRDVHGVIIAVIVGVSEEELADSSEASRTIATPPPRFASMHKDERGMIKTIDEAFTKILGWTAEEVEGKRSLDFVYPGDQQLAVENWIEMMSRPGPARRVRQRLQHKDGHWIWFEVTNHNLMADPEYGCVVGGMVDISEEMAAQEALRAREQLLDRLTASLPVGVFQIDTERHVVFTNDRLHDILGVAPTESIAAQLASVVADERPRLDQAIDAVLRDGSNADVEVGVLLPGTADLRSCTVSLRALTHEDGTISGAIASVADVTDSARMQAELKRRATYDELTGCHNRASVVAALEESIASGRGKAERAVMFVDLDGFKEVNDRNGHAAGDELLRNVAARLLDAVRDTDLVGRIGGDEFLVVCPDIGGTEAAMRLAERVAHAISDEAVDAGTHRFQCQVSVGVAWSAGAGTSADALVATADRAMYDSKHARAGQPVLAEQCRNGAAIPAP